MTRRITVWTPVTDDTVAPATALLRHLDAQTLPVQEWELVLAAPPGPVVSDLERVAAHRPNVRVVVLEADEAPEGAADPMQAEGEWVLVLAPDDRLERTALSQLAQLGSEAGDHDVLTVRAQTAPRGAADRAVVLTRRDGSRDSGVGERSAEVVAAEPLRRRVAPSASDPAHVLSDVTADVHWVDGALELHGRAPLHAAGAAGADLVLVGRRTGVVLARPVDAFTVSGDDEDTEPGLLWSASVPVDAHDIDDELEVWLEVSSSDTDDEEGESSRTEERKPLVGRVAAAEDDLDAPAVIQGRLVSVRSDGEGVVVDLGATGRSLLGRLDPRQATVVEDATGSLLTVEVPQLEHRSTGHVDGALVLDGVPLPARLVLDENPRVECRLAGSPGRATLEWSFGPGPAAPTGCDVVTSATGEFVVSAPRPETPARPLTVRRPKAPARPQATGPVAALRRRLPKGVDPVVAKLSTMPSLRGAYRRATGLR
ncbi:hypothetical protein FHX52_3570 [Humibacillus xanthopallidus]|uniref:Uncharacterized protein n=1 Tax=Humibacillus xanthopallidus TaxID=412689 RepID=A0A543PRZ5_9MICO|nr:hypothetical protein [Humibacillus xanthopallidus]TQN46840.1 hypothetical protein FHX52_3570 [Humibacillus xanthopallidus]